MSVHIIIDGYNLIRQSGVLSAIEQDSLEEGREALVECLVSYKRLKHYPITVVFDGAEATSNLGTNRSHHKGVNIIFSRPGELADSVIKRLVVPEGERALVVTSDNDVADFAQTHGAATIRSEEFEERMKMASLLVSPLCDPGEEESVGWKPTTKKKGPSRRRSKRERKNRVKIRKL